MSLLPQSTRILQYNLNPLIAGSVALPKFSMTISENTENGPPVVSQDQLNLLTGRTLPTHVYVMVSLIHCEIFLYKFGGFQPQMKGEAKLPDSIPSPENVAVIG